MRCSRMSYVRQPLKSTRSRIKLRRVPNSMVALPLLDRGSGGSYATILEPLMRIFRSPAGLERSTCVIN